MDNENNTIVGHAPGSPNGGRDISIQIQRQSNRHRLHGSAAFTSCRERGFLGLAAPVPLGGATQRRLVASSAPDRKGAGLHARLLCDARKLTHVAYLRRDPLVPELLGIERVTSQSALSRFFAAFDSAGGNLRCFVRSGTGAWTGCPAARKVTRWTWIPHGCRTRMDIMKAWRAVTPGGGSSPVCIRCWRSSPRCGWWPSCIAVENRPAFSGRNHIKNQFLQHRSGLSCLNGHRWTLISSTCRRQAAYPESQRSAQPKIRVYP